MKYYGSFKEPLVLQLGGADKRNFQTQNMYQ